MIDKNDSINWAMSNKPLWGKYGKIVFYLKRLFMFLFNLVIVITSPIWILPFIIVGFSQGHDTDTLRGEHLFLFDSTDGITYNMEKLKKKAINEYSYTLFKMGACDGDHAYQWDYVHVEDDRKNREQGVK